MKTRLICIAAVLALAGALAADDGATTPGPLGAPVRIEAAGKPVDVDVGHADPYVCDWNGDGLPDLLVGQFGSGKLRIYLNEGTRKEPKLGEPRWFKAGGADGTVPSG
jgi:hypothetical protein